MQPIFLTGFMGAGKSTIGEHLAHRLSCAVIDTDNAIEHMAQKKIKDIFQDDGEAAFRALETQALQQVTAPDYIITTGGGLVVSDANRRWMKTHGFIIYLHCDIEEVFRRIGDDPERPLLKGKQMADLRALQKRRQTYYRQSDARIDTTGRSVGDIVADIQELMPLAHR